MLFDSHAHLNDERFDGDVEKCLERAGVSGVTRVMVPGADLESSRSAVNLAARFEGLYAAVGVHPHDASGMDEKSLEILRQLSRHPKVRAVGEIGLDYYYDHTPRDLQKFWFRRQLQLAGELELPVIIHDRDAHQDVMDLLDEAGHYRVGVIMHCFSGSKELAQQYLDRGAYISLAGPVTFKNARKAVEVAMTVPMDRLLVETDSPYLTPVPHRGKRNEPAYVRHVAERIAEIRGMDVSEVAARTTENALRVFGIGGAE